MIRVRAALAEDYGAFAQLVPELGAGGPVPGETHWATDLAKQSLVAESNGSVVGYLVGGTAGRCGQVHQLVVDPQQRRQGIAQLLLAAFAGRLREAGCTSWQLNVEGHNAAARALSERSGFRLQRRSDWVEVQAEALTDLPRDATLVGRLVTPAEDEAIEARFDLPVAAMRWFRTIGGAALVAVDARDEARSFGVWLQEKRLVRPLRLDRAAALPALLAPVAPAGTITLVLEEGLPELIEALHAAGGTTVMQEYRYVGELPTAPPAAT